MECLGAKTKEQILQQLADDELVARYRSESDLEERQECINELFRRHYTRVASWCLRFTGKRESAADLAQDVFIKAYRSLDAFRGNSSFSTWLYAIARNHCWNEMRARSIRPEQGDETLLTEIPDRRDNPEGLLEKEDARRQMKALIDSCLNETERNVLTLYYADELPFEAITRLLGLKNASGAKAYIVSARRKLKRAVQQWETRKGTLCVEQNENI